MKEVLNGIILIPKTIILLPLYLWKFMSNDREVTGWVIGFLLYVLFVLYI